MANKKADITQRPDGKWQSKVQGNEKASFVTDTQKEAYAKQRDSFAKGSGGEISVHGKDGKIREKNTISPMKDHFPPKG